MLVPNLNFISSIQQYSLIRNRRKKPENDVKKLKSQHLYKQIAQLVGLEVQRPRYARAMQ